MKRLEMAGVKGNAISFSKAVITSAALTMDYGYISDGISQAAYSNSNLQSPLGNASKLLYAMETPTISFYLLLGFLALFYMCLYDGNALPKRAAVRIAAAFITICAIVGKLFYVYNDIWLFTRGTIQSAKGIFVFCGLFMLFSELLQFGVSEYVKYCEKYNDKAYGGFFAKKYAMPVCAAAIFAAWLPTIAAYYPAVFMGDSESIIYMAYNYPTELIDMVLPLKEGIYVTDHHPVLYTMYVSMALHAVKALGGSYNLGIFICAIMQCLFTVFVLAYSCVYCARGLKNEKPAFAAVLFYAIFPLIPQYAIMISKDTFFADLLLLFAVLIHKAVNAVNAKKDIAALIAVSAGIVLMRKNGVYILMITLLFAIMLYRAYSKRWIFALVCVILVHMLYTGAVLPNLGIRGGSVAEMLSIPFQQTARYVKYHGSEVTDEERKSISAVLDYDALAESYSGSLSDPVKGTYNKNAQGDELKAYFAVWIKMFFKHPEEYAASFLNNYYGYFYPVVNDAMKLARTSVGSMANADSDGYFDFSHLYDGFHYYMRDMLAFYVLIWMRVPVLNLFMTSALYVWAVLAALFLKALRRDKAAVLSSFMYLALMLTVLSGPSNAINYDRYVFPCILGMPFLISLIFSEKKGEY